VKRNAALIIGLVAIAVFWSAFGFPMTLGVLIMAFRLEGPSSPLPLAAAAIASVGFIGSSFLLRRWSR